MKQFREIQQIIRYENHYNFITEYGQESSPQFGTTRLHTSYTLLEAKVKLKVAV